jgi:hypothetical protein
MLSTSHYWLLPPETGAKIKRVVRAGLTAVADMPKR